LSFNFLAILIFRTQMKREPEIATRQSDIEKLYEIRDHVKHEMKLNGDVVENDAFKYVVFYKPLHFQ